MLQSRADRVPAPLLVLTAVASVQVGSALARTLFDDLGAAGVTLLRLALSAALLLALVRPRARSWDRRAWQAALMLGATMAGMNLVFYLALRTVPLGVAVTVEFVGPLLLALAQTRRLLDLLWACLAASGVVLLGAHPGSDVPLSGLALALLAGLFWAGYILASARVGQVLPGVDGLAVALAVGALLVLPFGLDGASAVLDRPSLLVAAAGVALLSSVLSYGLELVALRRMPTRVFGILMSIEPAAAALAGLVVLDEQLGPREVAALLLVSLASAGVTLGRRADAGPLQPLE
ncbi:MAG: rane protein [Frankiales bacterium]|nr:rane protein [Frankiales bacterium]